MNLNLHGVRFGYPDTDFQLAVDNLTINPAETVALVGPSGSGKTTLLNLIAGILLPKQGNIIVNGQTVNKLSDSARRQFRLQRIGMIFQTFELIDYLDVRDNILLQARLSQPNAALQQLENRALQLASKMGLESQWHQASTRLSQGERQRVAACRALLLGPPLVLADEPTGNLDPASKQWVIEQLVDEVKSKRQILFMVTHDHSLLPHFDRTLDINDLVIDAGSSR